jgi:hypothetical protein
MRLFKQPKKQGEWKLWFAWYPVYMSNGNVWGFVWLEKVWRSKSSIQHIKYKHKLYEK